MSERPTLKHLAQDEGKALSLGKTGLLFKAGTNVNSSYSMGVLSFPAGAAQPLHAHPWEETMYVLEGELEMVGADGERRPAGRGCTMHVPAFAVHGFVNVGEGTAKLLMVGGAAQESYFDDLAAAISRADSAASVGEVKARHGVESIGPITLRGK